MILHIAKGIWAMRKKKKKYPCPKHGKKKKEKENKDSSYLKIKDRKRCEFHPEKFHTHAHLDLIG